MQPMHLQLCAINCHLQLTFYWFYNYFAPLTILTTMLQLHLQLMTSSSYILKLFSSMIMSICPISCKWNQIQLHLQGVKIAPSGIHRCIIKLLKVCVFLLKYIRGIMGVCFHWCIYKVVFNLYLGKITTYLPSLTYQAIYLYVYLPNQPRLFTCLT